MSHILGCVTYWDTRLLNSSLGSFHLCLDATLKKLLSPRKKPSFIFNTIPDTLSSYIPNLFVSLLDQEMKVLDSIAVVGSDFAHCQSSLITMN